jgi:hypothetical protein
MIDFKLGSLINTLRLAVKHIQEQIDNPSTEQLKQISQEIVQTVDTLEQEMEFYIREFPIIARKLDKLEYRPGDPHALSDEIIQRYINLKLAGATAQMIFRVSVLDGIEEVHRIKILRTLFGFSLKEAVEIAKASES